MSFTINTPDANQRAAYNRIPASTPVATIEGATPVARDAPVPGKAVWGYITGTLQDQSDLWAQLQARTTDAEFQAHTTNVANPHQVTKAQVGLGNVDNTSDATKPVSGPTAAAIAAAVGGSLTVTSGQISDATVLGRDIITSPTALDVWDDLATANPIKTAATLSTAGLIDTRAAVTGELGASFNPGFRNMLDNGDFQYGLQVGAGTVVTSTAFICDRWRAGIGGATKFDSRTFNIGASLFSPGPALGSTASSGQGWAQVMRVCGRITTTTATAIAAGEYGMLTQGLEGFRMRGLPWGRGITSGSYMTLSFAARSSVTGTYFVSLYNVLNTRSYVASFLISSPNVFGFYEITIPVDSNGAVVGPFDAARFIELRLCGAAGTTFQTATLNSWQAGNFLRSTAANTALATTIGATIDFGMVQLEIGNRATIFETLPWNVIAANCARYYQRVGRGVQGILVNMTPPSGIFRFKQQLPVPMRAVPTISLGLAAFNIEDWAITNNACTGVTVSAVNQNDGSVYDITLAATGGVASPSSRNYFTAYMATDQIVLDASL